VQPEKEIEKRLVTLEIEAEETRRGTARNIIIVVLLAVVFSLLSYSYPQYGIFIVIDMVILILGVVIGVVVIGLPILARPLRTEYRAFQRIARAIQVLEKSQEPVAYRKVLRDVTCAYNALSGISLTKGVEWHKKTNETLHKFLENLEMIVLPAIRDSVIRIDHLEEIALAVYSLDPAKIDAVNKTLEAESSYKKSTVDIDKKISHRVFDIFRIHTTLKYGLVFCSLIIVCGIFYYMVVTYLDIQKEYVFGASVAAFIGLLTMYFRGKQKSIVEKP
jgi:hypothetical protein